mgnify:CR=1 FL=1
MVISVESMSQTQGFQVTDQTVTQAEGIENIPYIVNVDLTNIHVVDMYPIPDTLKCVIRYAIAKKYGVENKPCEILLKQSFDNEIQFRVFKSIPVKHLYKIMFNGYYVHLLTFLTHHNRCLFHAKCNNVVSYTTLDFIIGMMSNNKLFVHLVSTDYHFARDGADSLPSDKDVQLEFMTSLKDLREFFFYYLGYHRDIELDPEAPLSLQGSNEGLDVRVQGDITMSIQSVDINALIANMIRQQIEHVALFYVARRLQDALLDYGITSESEPDGTSIRIPLWKIPRKPDLRDSFADKLSDFIMDLIRRDNTITKLFGDSLIVNVNLPLHRDEHMIWVFPGFAYEKPVVNTPFFREVHDIVVKEFLSRKDKYTIRFGRHEINYIGYPQHLSVIFDHSVIGRIMINVDFSANVFIAEEILMTHKEHEPFYWKWNTPKMIRIGNVNNQSINRENYFAIMLALKRWENEKKQKT